MWEHCIPFPTISQHYVHEFTKISVGRVVEWDECASAIAAIARPFKAIAPISRERILTTVHVLIQKAINTKKDIRADFHLSAEVNK